jgi:hypothetical protein
MNPLEIIAAAAIASPSVTVLRHRLWPQLEPMLKLK